MEYLLLISSSAADERVDRGLGKIMYVKYFTSCLAPNEGSRSVGYH